MAGLLNIKNGTRLQMGLDMGGKESPKFDMVTTFAKAVDESAFLVSVPMRDGTPLPLDENQKILFVYGQGDDKAIIAGYADDLVKEGIRRYWKVRRVTEQRQFLQRSDQRYKVTLKMEYMQETWMPIDGVIPKEDCMSLDISASGMAVFLNRGLQVGEMIELTLPRQGVTEEGAKIENLAAVVCWLREAPRGSLFRNICGIQFKFSDDSEKARFQDYLGYMKKKYRL